MLGTSALALSRGKDFGKKELVFWKTCPVFCRVFMILIPITLFYGHCLVLLGFTSPFWVVLWAEVCDDASERCG